MIADWERCKKKDGNIVSTFFICEGRISGVHVDDGLVELLLARGDSGLVDLLAVFGYLLECELAFLEFLAHA